MKILRKKWLLELDNARLVQLEIESPDVARKARAGQFVVLMVKPEGERIPLTIVAADEKEGSITIIAQVAGFTTELLSQLQPGMSLFALVGPLGHPTPLKKYGQVMLVGGGVGIAEMAPVARALKNAGNHVVSILGARTKDLLILEDVLRQSSDETYIMTDDGSAGEKGFTLDKLKTLSASKKPDLVYAVGPIPMMKAVSLYTKELGIPTLVSLNPIMIDGTGMCGGCRVTTGGTTKFSCVDGPEFDAHLVDWDGLIKRNNIYREQEKHLCRLSHHP